MCKVEVNGVATVSTAELSVVACNSFDKIELRLGVRQVIAAIEDILSDVDMLDDETLDSLVDVAKKIQSESCLRNDTKRCTNCDLEINCANCEHFRASMV